MYIIGEIYKKGNSEAVSTYSKPAAPIKAGLPVERGADGIKAIDTGIVIGVSGHSTPNTIDVINTGLEVAVQVSDSITINIGDPVYIDAVSKKFTNTDNSSANAQVNATFSSLLDESAVIINADGTREVVRGALIDFAGGL